MFANAGTPARARGGQNRLYLLRGSLAYLIKIRLTNLMLVKHGIIKSSHVAKVSLQLENVWSINFKKSIKQI